MPRYVPTVRERVTSGHAMLALSNADMEKRLSMPHPLHRRRLRLVIEEQRGPQKGYVDHSCYVCVRELFVCLWLFGALCI